MPPLVRLNDVGSSSSPHRHRADARARQRLVDAGIDADKDDVLFFNSSWTDRLSFVGRLVLLDYVLVVVNYGGRTHQYAPRRSRGSLLSHESIHLWREQRAGEKSAPRASICSDETGVRVEKDGLLVQTRRIVDHLSHHGVSRVLVSRRRVKLDDCGTSALYWLR